MSCAWEVGAVGFVGHPLGGAERRQFDDPWRILLGPWLNHPPTGLFGIAVVVDAPGIQPGVLVGGARGLEVEITDQDLEYDPVTGPAAKNRARWG